MRLLILAALFAGMFSSSPAYAANVDEGDPNTVVVTVDRARIFRISEPARTVIIGNPSVADATIEDERTLVLTGRSFGVTNLIVLGADGNPVVNVPIVVRSHELNTVRIYKQASRETYACAPICEPTLTIGDNNTNFRNASTQIRQRNQLSDSTAASGQEATAQR